MRNSRWAIIVLLALMPLLQNCAKPEFKGSTVSVAASSAPSTLTQPGPAPAPDLPKLRIEGMVVQYPDPVRARVTLERPMPGEFSFAWRTDDTRPSREPNPPNPEYRWAIANVDYVPVATTLIVFAPGETEKWIVVQTKENLGQTGVSRTIPVAVGLCKYQGVSLNCADVGVQ